MKRKSLQKVFADMDATELRAGSTATKDVVVTFRTTEREFKEIGKVARKLGFAGHGQYLRRLHELAVEKLAE